MDFELVNDVARLLGAPRERVEGALDVLFGAIVRQAPADLGRALAAAVPEASGWRVPARPPGTRFVLGSAAWLPVGAPAAGAAVRGGVTGALAAAGLDPEAARRLVPAVMRFLRRRLGPENAERLSFAVPFLRRLGGAGR